MTTADGYGITMSCGKCGCVDDFDAFCKTTVGGDLLNGSFQCPKCNYAFKKQQSEYRTFRYGSEVCFIPGKVELVLVESRL